MGSDSVTFLIMVFLAAFTLVWAIAIPTFGTEAQTARRLRGRIRSVVFSLEPATRSLLRDKRLGHLSPLARWLETLPGMEGLRLLIEQAGHRMRAYQLLLICIVLALGGGDLMLVFFHNLVFAVAAGLVLFFLPILKLKRDRAIRILKFEEQLPEALDMMSRSLRAGHPFIDSMKLVSDEVADPLGNEFRVTYGDLNYGMSTKTALLLMLERLPSMSLMTVITGMLIQKDTGGNMAELMEKNAAVVRSRFRFQRRVRTLTAESRLAAMILAAMPFVVVGGLSFIDPKYLPLMFKDPTGRHIVLFAFVNLLVGMVWMRKIIQIKV